MNLISDLCAKDDSSLELFSRIATDLEENGYSINPAALPGALADELHQYSQQLDAAQYIQAGIGRANDHTKNEFVRTDEICWITGQSQTGLQWLQWCEQLQHFLNRRLFLGLFSFESHFAHYSPGSFYKRHLDAFKGEANRILSLVVYLNPGWSLADGGELVLYLNEADKQGIKVTPLLGTIVVFLSEDFPHEVLPAARNRHSIAGWFRVNTSVSQKVDPPL